MKKYTENTWMSNERGKFSPVVHLQKYINEQNGKTQGHKETLDNTNVYMDLVKKFLVINILLWYGILYRSTHALYWGLW